MQKIFLLLLTPLFINCAQTEVIGGIPAREFILNFDRAFHHNQRAQINEIVATLTDATEFEHFMGAKHEIYTAHYRVRIALKHLQNKNIARSIFPGTSFLFWHQNKHHQKSYDTLLDYLKTHTDI